MIADLLIEVPPSKEAVLLRPYLHSHSQGMRLEFSLAGIWRWKGHVDPDFKVRLVEKESCCILWILHRP